MAQIFISHASVDQPIAEAVARLLEGGIGVTHKQIFCTSLEDQGIPAGADFKRFIEEQLRQCEIVIALITQNYYASAFCMCELGATWIKAKNFIPILVPPLGFSDLKGVLSGVQALRISDADSLDQVRDRIISLAKEAAGTARWTKRKGEFLEALDATLKKLPKPKSIKQEEFDKLKAEKDDYKREYAKTDEENKVLRQELAEVKKAKDKAAVAAIERKYSSEWETFEKLTQTASSRLQGFPSVVVEAFFQRCRRGDFRPDWDYWGDAPVQAAEEGLLEIDEDEGTFSLNENNPKIKKALSAVRALRNFINDEATEHFPKQYENRYEENLDISIRPFWDRHLIP